MNEQISIEQRLKNILEGTRAGTWEWNVQSGDTIFNERWAEIIGYTLQELSPVSIETWKKFVHPEDIANSGRLLQQHFNAETEYYECEARMRHKDGHWVWVLDRGKVCSWTDDGKPLWMFGTHIDITDRKGIREKLKESEERFRALSDASFGGVVIHDKGAILDCNQGLADMTGFSREELLGMNGFKLIEPDSLATVLRNVRNTYTERYEVKGIRKDGTVYPLSIKGKNVLYKGKEVRVIEFFDLTESKKAESRFEDIATNMGDWIWELDCDGKYIYASEKIEKILGYKPEEIIGKSPFDLMPIEEAEAAKSFFKNLIANKQPFSDYENWNLHKDGHLVCLSTSGTPTFDNSANLTGYRGVDKDITELKKAEQLKEEYHKQLETLAAETPGMFYQFERNAEGDYYMPYVSQAVSEVFQLTPEEISENAATLFNKIHPDDHQQVMESIEQSAATLEHWQQNFRIINNNGSTRWIYGQSTPRKTGEIVTWYGFAMDATEQVEKNEKRLELEKQLQQKYKMEAIGVMASGMAHNFNNNLAIILGNLELVQLHSSDRPDLKTFLDNARLALLRSRELISQIMTYTRHADENTSQTCKLDEVAHETYALLKSTFPSSIEFSLELPDIIDGLEIGCSKTRAQEALINLCNNSVQAMDERGSLVIHLTGQYFDTKEFPSGYTGGPGLFACLQVTDSGSGIPNEIKNRIFDPFFTTKGIGEGTGMGLATVKGIVESCEGFIKVESNVNQGTTISLYFPVMKQHFKKSSTIARGALKRGVGKILVVDDEPMVADMAQNILIELGYQVHKIYDPQEALSLIANDPFAFDLVLTDYTMPKLTGKELTDAIKSLRPDLPVILCSGLKRPHNDEKISDGYCTKPFEIPELAEVISLCLGAVSKTEK